MNPGESPLEAALREIRRKPESSGRICINCEQSPPFLPTSSRTNTVPKRPGVDGSLLVPVSIWRARFWNLAWRWCGVWQMGVEIVSAA